MFFFLDEESSPIVQRYESYLSGSEKGYFDVEEFEQIVEYYLRHGRTNDGYKAVELGLKLHPNSSMLQIKHAKICLADSEYDKANRLLTSLVDTNDIEVGLLKIEASLHLGLTEEADNLAKNLIRENRGYSENIFVEIALLYISANEFEKALSFLKKGDKINKENTDLLFEMAICYEQLRDLKQAIETYNRIIDIDAYTSEAWFNLAQIRFSQEKYRQALEAYNFALAIDPDDSLACVQKAHTLFQLEQYTEALESYKEYEELTGDKWANINWVAESYEKLGEYENAIKHYRDSILQNGLSYDTLCGIAFCLLELGLFGESFYYIEKAIELNEEIAEAWVYLGEAYLGTNDIENALIAYLKAVTIDPEQPETLMAIANICMEIAEYEIAMQYYYAALEINDAVSDNTHLLIAIAAYSTANEDIAAAELKKAMDENLDSTKLFLEIYPEAGHFIQNLDY
jgi:tetratricopeptide (TPR) repeat protein